jgi:hypothetical protein
MIIGCIPYEVKQGAAVCYQEFSLMDGFGVCGCLFAASGGMPAGFGNLDF